MKELAVRLHGTLIGTIKETRTGGRFAYADAIATSHPGAPLLSASLPVKKRPFGEARTANWFEGLLPEGRRREEACRSLGISTYDWIGLLAQIGWECAGAASIYDPKSGERHEGSYKQCGPRELARIVSQLPSWEPQIEAGSFRMSLGGFQDKLCVTMPKLEANRAFVDASHILMPYGDAPTTHILKPEPQAYPGAAESEAWAMTVAAEATPCARVAMLELEDAAPILVVERYDREEIEERPWPENIKRIHQEDACQALGLPPSRKYASEKEAKGDDPTYKGIAEILLRYAEDPEKEFRTLLKQITANYVLGNWDAHAKNISLLYKKPAAPTVAPLYDVVPIAEVEPRTRLLSLRINGSLKPEEVSRNALIAEAHSWGMPSKDAADALDACLSGLARGLAVAGERFPEASSRHESAAIGRIESLAG